MFRVLRLASGLATLTAAPTPAWPPAGMAVPSPDLVPERHAAVPDLTARVGVTSVVDTPGDDPRHPKGAL
jgi:hypothetical protein